MAIKEVAVIGLGPSGAIAIDALVKEKAFDKIRVFERREAPGGCWLQDPHPPPHLAPSSLEPLALRTADPALAIPTTLPTTSCVSHQPRYTESSVYPYLETNVDALPMSFTTALIPSIRTPATIAKHGADSPFRHHSVIREYVAGLVAKGGYSDLVSFHTTVELAEKVRGRWRLVLRQARRDSGEESQKRGGVQDEWWEEWFDALVVASGHYSVPYIPLIPGLSAFQETHPGSVKHSKMFRGRDAYRGKRVVVVGASVSAADIAYDLVGAAEAVYAVVLGHKANGYFGDEAFRHPGLVVKPSVERVETVDGARRVRFMDGTTAEDVDEIIFGTGYSWSLPFLPSVKVRNNRVPGLYQHVVWQDDPSLVFVGAVGAGLTFRVFEWQAVLAARVLAGRARLPSVEEQRKWEADRIVRLGDGALFTMVFPDFEEYFETLRDLAGEPTKHEEGRVLPRFEKRWLEVFMAGHELRKKWWKEENERARIALTETPQARL